VLRLLSLVASLVPITCQGRIDVIAFIVIVADRMPRGYYCDGCEETVSGWCLLILILLMVLSWCLLWLRSDRDGSVRDRLELRLWWDPLETCYHYISHLQKWFTKKKAFWTRTNFQGSFFSFFNRTCKT